MGTIPPLLALITNDRKDIHFPCDRYLTDCFRDDLGRDRVPVRLFCRECSGRKKK